MRVDGISITYILKKRLKAKTTQIIIEEFRTKIQQYVSYIDNMHTCI